MMAVAEPVVQSAPQPGTKFEAIDLEAPASKQVVLVMPSPPQVTAPAPAPTIINQVQQSQNQQQQQQQQQQQLIKDNCCGYSKTCCCWTWTFVCITFLSLIILASIDVESDDESNDSGCVYDGGYCDTDADCCTGTCWSDGSMLQLNDSDGRGECW